MGINGYSAQYENDKLIPRDIDIIRHFALYVGALETRSKMLLDAFVACREDEMEYMKAAKDAFKEIDELTNAVESKTNAYEKLEQQNLELLEDNTNLLEALSDIFSYLCTKRINAKTAYAQAKSDNESTAFEEFTIGRYSAYNDIHLKCKCIIENLGIEIEFNFPECGY